MAYSLPLRSTEADNGGEPKLFNTPLTINQSLVVGRMEG